MSEWLQQVQDVGSSITGSIHKAILCVRRVEFSAAARESLDSGLLDRMKAYEEGGGKVAAMAAMQLQNDMRSKTSSTDSYQRLKQLVGKAYCTMQVQYNPASITINSTAGSIPETNMGDAGTNDDTQIIKPPKTTMEVSLIFDAVNDKDAFQWEKYRLSVGDLAAGVTALAKRSSYRVDKQVNALLALTVHGAVRHVVFHWSNFTFAGELTGVTANYTMFNPDGRPVRAKVDLTIVENDEGCTAAGEAYWDDAFNRLFSKEGEDYHSKNRLDVAPNLLHL